MELTVFKDLTRDARIYTLTIPMIDLVQTRLDRLDFALATEVSNDPDASISDVLLVLERIAFRIEQASEKS